MAKRRIRLQSAYSMTCDDNGVWSLILNRDGTVVSTGTFAEITKIVRSQESSLEEEEE